MHYLNNLWAALDFGSLWDMLLRLAAVLLCLTVHETCHGLAAYALGDPTARQAHRLSLNPLRHIDWFGLLMMFLAGFGWAKPVPVNPNYFKKPKQGMALTALAGPMSNFLLALIMLLAARIFCDVASYSEANQRILDFILMVAILSIGFSTWCPSRRWTGPRYCLRYCRTGPMISLCAMSGMGCWYFLHWCFLMWAATLFLRLLVGFLIYFAVWSAYKGEKSFGQSDFQIGKSGAEQGGRASGGF